MTDLIGSLGPVFVVSAAIFGPLSGWLAGRRDRHPVVWLAFGALLGPLALLLLWAAPPGRCSMCDTPVRGWISVCPVCGGPLTIGAGAGRYRTMERSAIDSIAPAAEPWAESLEVLPEPTAGRTVPALTMLRSRAAEGEPRPQGPSAPIPLPIERSAIQRLRRSGIAERAAAKIPRSSPYEADVASEPQVLATAVYFGGTAGLAVGGRYVITRQGPMFRLLGPVDVDPARVALERPLSRLAAAAVGERLVITEGDRSRVSLAIGMGALAGMSGPELEVALSAPEEAMPGYRPEPGRPASGRPG